MGRNGSTYPFERKKNDCNFCSLKIELNSNNFKSKFEYERNSDQYISKQHNTNADSFEKQEQNLRCKGFR